MARRRRTVARHARLRSPSIAGQLATIIAVALAVVLVSTAGTLAYATYDLAASFTEDAVELENQPAPPPDIGEIEGGVNLLLAGLDECEPEYAYLFDARCTGPDAGGHLNDVNILLHISDAPRRVTVVSFPRDLILRSPGCTRADGSRWGGGTTQINALYDIGGLNCVVDTVADLSEQPIQYAATVTFGGVIEITDAIGGVEVCLARGIRDSNTGIDWPAGPRVVEGVEALQFLRTRYGVGDQSDLARVGNQQQYMSRLVRKLVSEDVLTDPATLYRLASSGLRSVDPTTSLTNPLTLVQIALAVRDVPFDEIVFVQYPTNTAPNDPNRVVPNYTAAEPLWQALAENRPIQLTGAVGANGGVIEQTPAPTDTAAPTDPATPDPNATTAAPVDPGQEAVELPSSITGSTAAQETCSAGNLSR